MGRKQYEAYMASGKWIQRRTAFFQKHPKVCQGCGTTNRIHLHHKTYERMGHELDEDMVALCEKCHDVVHAIHRRGKMTLMVATAKFLAGKDATVTIRKTMPTKPNLKIKGKKSVLEKRLNPTRGFVPRNMRNVVIDEQGRMRNLDS